MLEIITQELNKVGFQTRVYGTMVLVSLNRPMFKDEVEIALEQVFEGCQFNVIRQGKNSFLVQPSL